MKIMKKLFKNRIFGIIINIHEYIFYKNVFQHTFGYFKNLDKNLKEISDTFLPEVNSMSIGFQGNNYIQNHLSLKVNIQGPL